MKTLVTGASGFVGTHLGKIIPIERLEDQEGWIDIRNEERLLKAIVQIAPDQVIHLAAQSFVPASITDPRETIEINVIGTLNLLQVLSKIGFSGRFLYIGTGDVYGAVPVDQLPITETQIPRPRNPYAVSKLAAESLCFEWSLTSGFEIILARPFTHIGPGQAEHFVIQSWAKQLIEIRMGKRPPIIYVGNTSVSRDFTDVDDVIGAYLLLLEKGSAGEIYNVCSGQEYRLDLILNIMLRGAPGSIEIVQDPMLVRVSEQLRTVGTYKKLAAATGWFPKINLESSIDKVLAFWEQRLTAEPSSHLA